MNADKQVRFRSTGFTLVELLVVIAILATLVGLLLPAVQAARESSRRVTCANHLKQISLACQSHLTAMSHFPTGGWNGSSVPNPNLGADAQQPGGWCFTILPFAEFGPLYELAGTDLAAFQAAPVPIFVCPSRRGSALTGGITQTDYAGNRGSWCSTPATPTVNDVLNREVTFGIPISGDPNTFGDAEWLSVANTLNTPQRVPQRTDITAAVPTGGVIFAGSALRPAAIRDGLSNTLLAGEKYVPQRQFGVAAGATLSAYVGDSADTLRGGQRQPEGDQSPGTDILMGAFGGPHTGVFNVTFCDGSVRSLSLDIEASVHFLLAAKADRQPVNLQD